VIENKKGKEHESKKQSGTEARRAQARLQAGAQGQKARELPSLLNPHRLPLSDRSSPARSFVACCGSTKHNVPTVTSFFLLLQKNNRSKRQQSAPASSVDRTWLYQRDISGNTK